MLVIGATSTIRPSTDGGQLTGGGQLAGGGQSTAAVPLVDGGQSTASPTSVDPQPTVVPSSVDSRTEVDRRLVVSVEEGSYP